jgi:two-component system, chemotaxis family, protein-glutamate methylesterase/glutaminase
MAKRDVVAIGTSAGGVEALLFVAERLPREFPASVLVTFHLPSHFNSSLDEILNRVSSLPASFADHGESIERGRIYIAPPTWHLLLDGNRTSLGSGPRENNARPARRTEIEKLATTAPVSFDGQVLYLIFSVGEKCAQLGMALSPHR